MIQYLCKFYSGQLSLWFYFYPVLVALFSLILFLTNGEHAAYLLMTTCVTILCAFYFDLREQQRIMTAIFPIKKSTLLKTDFIFIFRYTCLFFISTIIYFGLFSSLFQQKLILPTIQFLIMLISLSFIIIGLFFSFRFIKYGKSLNVLMILMPAIIFGLNPIITFFTTSQLLVSLVFSGSIIFLMMSLWVRMVQDERSDVA
ncbi:ABC-2 transporter permease [Solibacillus sp. FSL R7-0682]|uniref:ABC-2 transporter permease n=1 Tax=Solibacillus sp. FSL R7-0682 TaxID=2921690 RepID=UPI004040892B